MIVTFNKQQPLNVDLSILMKCKEASGYILSNVFWRIVQHQINTYILWVTCLSISLTQSY